MKSFDYDAVVCEGEVYCLSCFEGDTENNPEVSPIFADSEWEWPGATCTACGELFDYMNILNAPLRTWEEGPFRLFVWESEQGWNKPQTRIKYIFQFYDQNYEFSHRIEYWPRHEQWTTIFSGEDFGLAPQHDPDSDTCIAALLSFLSLRPGDTDRDYFANYTSRQLSFAQTYGETLSVYALALEEEIEEEEYQEEE